MPLSAYFTNVAREVDAALERLVPTAAAFPPRVHEAMRYSLFAGGKRLRPMLAMAACEAVGGARAKALGFAAALELIHTYTLIHDDLPAMDDDGLRRGRPTCHKQFDDATAILAGDALLTLAFEVMTARDNFPGVPAETLLTVASETARAAGSLGTVGGQMVDIQSESAEPDMATLEYIHTHKTGKLITASVRGGARLGGAQDDQLAALTGYGERIGLAFQIVDDVLGVEGDAKALGKPVGSDAKRKKMTYPAAAGIKTSRQLAADLVDGSVRSLEMFGAEAGHLRDLAQYIIARTF